MFHPPAACLQRAARGPTVVCILQPVRAEPLGRTTRQSMGNSYSVVYVWQSDYPWDVRTEKICRALADAGVRVHLAARNRRWEAEREALPEAAVSRLPSWRWAGRRLDAALQLPAFFNPRWIRLLARLVREEQPQVVIVRDIPLCPTALWVGRRFGV